MAELKKFPNINTFAWDSSKMQHWDVKTKRSGSGRLRTMTTQQLPQYTISASFAVLNQEQYETMMGFYATVKGGKKAFDLGPGPRMNGKLFVNSVIILNLLHMLKTLSYMLTVKRLDAPLTKVLYV